MHIVWIIGAQKSAADGEYVFRESKFLKNICSKVSEPEYKFWAADLQVVSAVGPKRLSSEPSVAQHSGVSSSANYKRSGILREAA